MKVTVPFLLILLAAFLMPDTVRATHLRSGDLSVEQTCNSLTFKITLTVYLNTLSRTTFGGANDKNDGHIDFGDGNYQLIPGGITVTSRPDLGPNIGVAIYTIEHTYSNEGFYKIFYFERDRNANILNIPNSLDVPYTAIVSLLATNEITCNHFPKLSVTPVDRVCSGGMFSHNPGVTDEDGDSLSYELTVPAGYDVEPVVGYLFPDNPDLYKTVNYSTASEDGSGPPTFSIDPASGQIVWNAPGDVGEYNIAFKIIEWRRDETTGVLEILSITIRDMQIIVGDCPNTRPYFENVPQSICVEAGTVLNYDNILGKDLEKDPVKVEFFSEVFDFPPEKTPATYIPATSEFGPSNPPVQIGFHWDTDCIHVRDQAYSVIMKITDKPNSGTQLVTFGTWSIKVVAPAVTGVQATLDLVHRTADLKWDAYTCSNAETIQVWRRVGSYSYTPGSCDAGIPRYRGYELVGEVAPQQTQFTDTNKGKGLSVGAMYCYRLVASFKLPAGGKSYVSQEVCVDPILTDAPVITHVSVEQTGSDDGSIRVSWRSPFGISKVQFPGPYKYEIYRGDGFESNVNLVNISEKDNDQSDTTFLDSGINTEENIYNYRIVIYSRTQNTTEFIPIDTSAVASSVRLTVIPGTKKMKLSWDAVVPWSNVIPEDPAHFIYRGEGNGSLTLLANVDVTENGFEFTDETVDDNKFYCYKVITRGTYGNPQIQLQENSSQTVCRYPINNLLPCKPVAALQFLDCEAFLNSETCGENSLSNPLSWEPDFSEGCRVDIVSYNIYGADSKDGDYTLLANSAETFFVEAGLTSLLRCYKVEAIDALGHVSEESDPVCSDNCAYYELPNVFTPNGDGCNDTFGAYYDPGEAETPCKVVDINKCPRFVESVEIKIYNRWGKEVYAYTSDRGRSIYIDWNGTDKKGNELESGTYFYIADINFFVLDPEKKHQRIKGWVHLLR